MMNNERRLTGLAGRLQNFCHDDIEHVFATVFPDQEIGYLPPSDGAFFTAEQARIIHTRTHETMRAFVDCEPLPEYLSLWTAARDEIANFIERIVGEPADLVDETLEAHKRSIEKHIHEYVNIHRNNIMNKIGPQNIDPTTLRIAFTKAFWDEARNLDQTVPASVVTDHDEMTLVFELPHQYKNIYLERNIHSDKSTVDALRSRWSVSANDSLPILAIKVSMLDVIGVLGARETSTTVLRGGGLIGEVRDGILHARPLTGDFVLEPHALVSCTDASTRQLAAEWLTTSCRAAIGEAPRRADRAGERW